jgi:transposase-like protein
MSKRSEEKRTYWRGMLERRAASGLSVRQFCREEQVSEASFHSWKRRLARGDRSADESSEKGDPKRSAAKSVTKQTDNAAVFIPVRLSPAANDLLEIVHPRGHVVRLPAVFDEISLRRVLNVLDRQADA